MKPLPPPCFAPVCVVRRFLKPLRAHVSRLQNEPDFEALPESFTPILHTLLLIWRSSAYYNTPPRLVLLLQEIVNALIRQARTFLCGDKVFAALDMGETKKAIDALNAILRVFGRFKTLYFHYKVRRHTGPHQHSGTCLHGLGFCSVFGARLAVADHPLFPCGLCGAGPVADGGAREPVAHGGFCGVRACGRVLGAVP